MSKTNIIEINGRKYDSHSGELLDVDLARLKPTAKQSKHVIHDVVRKPALSGRRSPEHSRTLMRHVIEKPASAAGKRLQAHASTDVLAKRQVAKLVPKKPARSLDPGRAKRAHQVSRSQLITHFAPVVANASYHPPAPARPAFRPIQPKPSKTAAKKPLTTADILEIALSQADSHNQPRPAKAHSRRKTGMVLASVLAVLLVGFVAYQEVPNTRLELASAKAGFAVSQPGYRPAGYSLGQLNYGQGLAILSFHSNSDDRAYSLTQKTSSWNDQSLIDNYLRSQAASYQTADAGSHPVYLYGDGNATWLDGGVWYVVQSHGALSAHQLIEIASSL